MHPLLEGLVDYAGLFPPASLGLPEALRNYAAYLVRDEAPMLARFILPSTRIHELAPHVDAFDARRPLRLSLLAVPGPHAPRVDGAVRYAVLAADAFAATAAERVRAETFETRIVDPESDPAGRLALAAAAAAPRAVYVELPHVARPHPAPGFLETLAEARRLGHANLAAKIRCGGDQPHEVPGAGSVAGFLHRAIALGVPFKATAGLHHPVRSLRDGRLEHGFLNVFTAGILGVILELSERELLAIVEETDPLAFSLAEGQVAWRHLRASSGDVATARRAFAHSYGSCSFDDPTGDLRALGWLGSGTLQGPPVRNASSGPPPAGGRAPRPKTV